MNDIILEMSHITKEFPGVKALDDVSVKVGRGEIHALCGENGAGKSTLMNVLSGSYPYGTYSGDIIYNGKVCKFRSLKDSEEKGIVIIHQELALSPYLSVAENIFMGNEQLSMPGVINWDKTNREKVVALIEVCVTPHRLSGFDHLAERIYNFPEVDTVYLMSGTYDFCVMLEGKTLREVAAFVSEKLSTLESVTSTATHFVLKKYKDHGTIMVPEKKSERQLIVP